jgi:nucleoside 2-deoxyribosyltransferase
LSDEIDSVKNLFIFEIIIKNVKGNDEEKRFENAKEKLDKLKESFQDNQDIEKIIGEDNIFNIIKEELSKKDKSYSEIFHRDTKWISICDMVVAEVSTASLGVGWECCYAQFLNIPVIALCDKKVKISAMIGGNPYINKIYYDNDDDLIQKLDCKIKSLKKK